MTDIIDYILIATSGPLSILLMLSDIALPRRRTARRIAKRFRCGDQMWRDPRSLRWPEFETSPLMDDPHDQPGAWLVSLLLTPIRKGGRGEVLISSNQKRLIAEILLSPL
jgi:hypothetical protein